MAKGTNKEVVFQAVEKRKTLDKKELITYFTQMIRKGVSVDKIDSLKDFNIALKDYNLNNWGSGFINTNKDTTKQVYSYKNVTVNETVFSPNESIIEVDEIHFDNRIFKLDKKIFDVLTQQFKFIYINNDEIYDEEDALKVLIESIQEVKNQTV